MFFLCCDAFACCLQFTAALYHFKSMALTNQCLWHRVPKYIWSMVTKLLFLGTSIDFKYTFKYTFKVNGTSIFYRLIPLHTVEI